MRGRHVFLSLALFISLVHLTNCLPTKLDKAKLQHEVNRLLHRIEKTSNVDDPQTRAHKKRQDDGLGTDPDAGWDDDVEGSGSDWDDDWGSDWDDDDWGSDWDDDWGSDGDDDDWGSDWDDDDGGSDWGSEWGDDDDGSKPTKPPTGDKRARMKAAPDKVKKLHAVERKLLAVLRRKFAHNKKSRADKNDKDIVKPPTTKPPVPLKRMDKLHAAEKGLLRLLRRKYSHKDKKSHAGKKHGIRRQGQKPGTV